jgi:hypothetical protein
MNWIIPAPNSAGTFEKTVPSIERLFALGRHEADHGFFGVDGPQEVPSDLFQIAFAVSKKSSSGERAARADRAASLLSRDGMWSVFTGPGIPFVDLTRLCRNNQVRRATVEEILKAGGSLQPSSGPPHHHDLSGLTPQQFDAILGVPEPNPVPKLDRWQPS